MAAAPIDFYFDFSSPYGYLAAQRIDALAARHDRTVRWRPFLLGAVFKETGGKPLVEIPMKGAYARRDMERSARRLGIDFRLPDSFPFMSVAACRAYYWLAESDEAAARALAKALYARAFVENKDIAAAQSVVDCASGLGIEAQALSAALQDPEVKQRLVKEVDAALAAGVFGSPFFVVEGEPFWGHDRLEDLDHWLAAGGW